MEGLVPVSININCSPLLSASIQNPWGVCSIYSDPYDPLVSTAMYGYESAAQYWVKKKSDLKS